MHRLLWRCRGLSLAAAVPFAFIVRENAATPVDPTAAIAENERFEKRWTLTQSPNHAINRVRVNVPGLTVVSYDRKHDHSKTLGAVRVSGDSAELVDCVDVVPLPPNGVELRWKSKECAERRGHLLTTLALARQAQANDIRAHGSGTVVVEDGVLLTDCAHATVRVATKGTGDVFVTSEQHAMHLDKLELSMLGTGNLQFIGPEKLSLREQLLVEVAGEGKAHVAAGTIDAAFVKSSIAGSGEVTVQARKRLHADKLKTSIVGTGTVVYDGDGECRVQRATIAGNGEVHARAIHCHEASVESYGDADVTWNVRDKIEVNGWSTTTVRYVDQAPKVVTGKSISLKPAPVEDKSKRVEAAKAPRKEAAFNEIQAVYESTLDAMENVTGLGKAVRYVMNAFADKDATVKVDIKTEKTQKTLETADAPNEK